MAPAQGQTLITAALSSRVRADDLTKKAVPGHWNKLVFGAVPFIVCYGAAGPAFQLYMMRRDSTVLEPIFHRLDMQKVGPRAARSSESRRRVLMHVQVTRPVQMHLVHAFLSLSFCPCSHISFCYRPWKGMMMSPDHINQNQSEAKNQPN